MDSKSDTITLYSSQREEVAELITRNGVYYVKMEFIRRKYEEVAGVFINAYEWYVENARKIVDKPSEAESAVWAFKDMRCIESHPGYSLLVMEVPINEAVFFDMADWNKILNMSYIGLCKEEEMDYKKRLAASGVKYDSDVVTTSFYPLFKRELYRSWNNLFRYDEDIRSGRFPACITVQAGLWKIEKEWVKRID